MRRISAEAAPMTDEFGVQVGRWEDYADAGSLPFGAMWCVVPPGSRTDPDSHPELELAVVVDGAATFESGETRIDAGQGSAVLLSSHERHVVHNRSDDAPLVMLSLYWMPAELGDTAQGATELGEFEDGP